MADITLCGKCGLQQVPCACPPETAIALPVEKESIYDALKKLEQIRCDINSHPVIDDMPAYRATMTSTIKAHGAGDRSHWCDMCKKIGNTFGCAKCNGGPTTVRW